MRVSPSVTTTSPSEGEEAAGAGTAPGTAGAGTALDAAGAGTAPGAAGAGMKGVAGCGVGVGAGAPPFMAAVWGRGVVGGAGGLGVLVTGAFLMTPWKPPGARARTAVGRFVPPGGRPARVSSQSSVDGHVSIVNRLDLRVQRQRPSFSIWPGMMVR